MFSLRIRMRETIQALLFGQFNAIPDRRAGSPFPKNMAKHRFCRSVAVHSHGGELLYRTHSERAEILVEKGAQHRTVVNKVIQAITLANVSHGSMHDALRMSPLAQVHAKPKRKLVSPSSQDSNQPIVPVRTMHFRSGQEQVA